MSLTELTAVGEGDEFKSEVDFEVAEGRGGEREDMMVEGIDKNTHQSSCGKAGLFWHSG